MQYTAFHYNLNCANLPKCTEHECVADCHRRGFQVGVGLVHCMDGRSRSMLLRTWRPSSSWRQVNDQLIRRYNRWISDMSNVCIMVHDCMCNIAAMSWSISSIFLLFHACMCRSIDLAIYLMPGAELEQNRGGCHLLNLFYFRLKFKLIRVPKLYWGWCTHNEIGEV